MAEKISKAAKKTSGINPKVLESLINKCEGIKGEMDEARGELGAAIKNAEESHGVHRKAFKQMLALKRMDSAARSDFLRAFDDYRTKLGFDDQADIFDEEAGDEKKRRAEQAKGASDQDRAAENAAALKSGISQLQ